MSFDKISPEALLYALAVFVALCVAYNSVMSAVNNRRKEREIQNKPNEEQDRKLALHEEMLKNDKKRLDKHDEAIDDMGEAIRILLRSNMALTSHAINGNSNDKLKDSSSEIQTYLVNRK